MEKKLFIGVGAFVEKVSGNTVTIIPRLFFGDDETKDPDKRRLDIDTAATPGRAAKWSAVKCDDRGIDFDGGRLDTASTQGVLANTVDAASVVGDKTASVYYEYTFFREQRERILYPAGTVWPPAGYMEYELTTLAYSKSTQNGAKAGLRFVGFHVSIVEQRGSLAKVHVRWAGKPDWRGPFWLDLDDLADCDKSPIDPNQPNDPINSYPLAKVGQPGALFIRMERASALHEGARNMRGPKLPIGQD